MNSSVRQSGKSGIRFLPAPLMAVVLAVGMAGCGESEPDIAPEPKAESMTQHWQLAVADLIRFRAITTAEAPDAKKLAAYRDRVKVHVAAMRRTARTIPEQDFLVIASRYLDDITTQLDRGASAAGDGKPKQAREASMRVGFILNEIARLTTLADL